LKPRAIRADHVLTMAGAAHAPGWIAFEEGRIAAVGRGEPPAGVACEDAGAGSIAIPGLVSAHTHLALGLFRGCADDRAFLDWIQQGVLPRIGRTSAEDWARGARVSAEELLRGGVTTIGDNFFRADGIAAAAATGQRIAFFHEVFGSMAADEDAYWAEVAAVLDAAEAEHPEARLGYSPHTPWTCPPNTFRRVVERARAAGRRLSFHLDESREEHDLLLHGTGPLAESLRDRGRLDRYPRGMTPTALAERLGGLGPATVVAHAVHVTPADVAILARTGTGVAHCPQSNMKLAEGIAPVAAMIEAGVTVALGVDSAASCSRLDLFAEMRAALHAQRAATGAVGAMTAANVLAMATRNGARVLGLLDDLGTLEPGKLADFVVLDAGTARHQPLRDPFDTVVHACAPEDVARVVIGGETRHRRDS
jgi:5-methylthioadenosine/S-adenosylhomocysteine deaminase